MRRILIAVSGALVVVAGGVAAAALLSAPTVVSAQETEAEEVTEAEEHPKLERAGAFIQDALADLVNRGVITDEQADAVTEALLDAVTEAHSNLRNRLEGFRDRARRVVGFGLDLAAETIGIETQDLITALREDQKTIAQVAEENGVDPEVVVGALVAAASEKIDQAAAERDADPERVAQLKQRLPEMVERLVNGRLPDRDRLPGLFRHFQGFAPNQDAGLSS